jgi:4-amino-4-deoxy-L-arabinose transferase-like glycosyltransferase
VGEADVRALGRAGHLGRLLLPALVLLVPVLALIAAGRFDGLYGQDPYAYYDYAIGPAREAVRSLRPLPPFFWPPGYPLLVALASLLIGATPAAGQLVSVLMGAATVVLTTLLAEEVWVRRTAQAGSTASWVALAAGLLVACHPQLWQSSAVVMADTTGLACATFGAWALARYARTRHGPWLILAAAGLAFALLARWIYGLAAIPCAAFALSTLLRRTVSTRSSQRALWLPAAGALLVAAFILSQLLFPAAGEPATPSVEAAPFAGSFEVYTWHPLNAVRREFSTTDGLLSYRLPNGLYYALAPAHRYYFTPLLAGLLLPGLWTALGRGRRALWWLLAWAGLVFAFHAGAPWQNFRFTLAYLTPLAVLAAVGLETLFGWLGPRWRRAVLVVFGLGLVAMLASAVQLTQSFIARKQADLRTVAEVEALLPPEARLLTFNMTFTFQHYSELETLELYYLEAVELPALLADGRPTYVLLDEHNIATQWSGEPLGATYRWLRDERGLEPIEQFGTLTLSRVN